MKVDVVNRQRQARIDGGRVKELVRWFMTRGGIPGRPCPWEAITVILADDAGIHRFNASFLKHDYPTDVIAFTYAPVPGTETVTLGDIVVSVERAARVGDRYGGVERELALYLAHGCDHLRGADDATPAQRRRMRSRECRWLRACAANGMLRGLISGTPRARRVNRGST